MNRSLLTLLATVLTSSSALAWMAACSSDATTVEPVATPDAAAVTNDAGVEAGSSDPDSGVCSDSVGTSSACSFFLDGGKGLPDGGAKFCLNERSCKNLLSSLKPRIAQRAIECLAAIPECTVDEQIQKCVIAALVTACPDPTGATFCDQGFKECPSPGGGSLTKAECLKWTAGMTGEWRSVFPMCLGTSNGCADPMICVPY